MPATAAEWRRNAAVRAAVEQWELAQAVAAVVAPLLPPERAQVHVAQTTEGAVAARAWARAVNADQELLLSSP